MNYRFQKFTTIYPIFLRMFLANNPGYENLSYQELYDRFVKTRYSLSNFYARHMKVLGNEAQELFANLEPLQKAWAREHGVQYEESNWVKDIVLAQVIEFQPDALYLENLNLFDYDFRQQLWEVCNQATFIIGEISSPIQDFTVFRDLNLIVTVVPHFAQLFRQNGATAALMPLAFESTILDEVKSADERDLDFTFVGTLGGPTGHHMQRYAMVEKVMSSSPLQVWGQVDEPPSGRRRVLAKAIYLANRILYGMGVSKEQQAKLPLIRRGVSWVSDPTLPSVKQRYPSRVHEPLFGLDNYEILARSKLVFNSHIDCAESYAGNMRLYEATGMGACLVTDSKINLPDLFDPEIEVVTYRSAEECIKKVRYLLDHEDERKAIAANGQRRTLRDHTIAQRVERLHELITEALAK